MRLKLTLLFVGLAALGSAQVWEKSIAPGLTYRMEIDQVVPRVIHALRFSPGSPTTARAELAGNTIFAETASKGRKTVTEMVVAQGALAGINGDYFPFTGDPLGAMVRSGQVLSLATTNRSSFGWKNAQNSSAIGVMKFKGTIKSGRTEVQFDNINAECGLNQITVNTDVAAFSLAKEPNVQILVKLDEANWGPDGTTNGVIESFTADAPAIAVPEGYAVIVGQGNKIIQLTSMRPGDRISIRYQADGFDWRKVDQLVSGGPVLLRDGTIRINADEEKFKDDFTKVRHPRTAVGRTANGDIWFVAVDGRQKMSEGATIQELADLMFKLGCRDAINLDGGGSTNLSVFGLTVNRPSDGKERPVANAVLFYGPTAPLAEGPLDIEAPASFDMSSTPTLRATEGGRPLEHADVIWSAQGAAWIDQGGMLRPLQPGTVTVTAWIKGKIVTKQLTVSKPKTGK